MVPHHSTQKYTFSHPPPSSKTSGNKVSRQTVLCGSQNIILNGKVIVQTGAIIRGDLANVKTGRYCVIGKKAVIRPPYKQFNTGLVVSNIISAPICFKNILYRLAFFPLYIGEHVYIGEGAIVSAAAVGSYVYIGKNAVIVSDVGLNATSKFNLSLTIFRDDAVH